MTFDLTEYLASWPYDPESVLNNIRRLKADDGREILQVREPMGLQQMEYSGRPDGARPQGHETWLAYYTEQAGYASGFTLEHDDCVRLMQEGILFYQRYLILFQMEDWSGVVRDTGRNLQYFDFTRKYAENQEDSLTLEQYRPYLMRMNAVGKAHLLRADHRHLEALDLLRSTLTRMKMLDTVQSPVFRMEQDKAFKHLSQLIADFEKEKPEDELERLQRLKLEAVRREDFEAAARLRDQIQYLESGSASSN
jgi:hypothetical protein